MTAAEAYDCPECGEPSDYDTAQCSSCGATFADDEVTILPDGADVCPRCGDECMTCIVCEHCGARFP